MQAMTGNKSIYNRGRIDRWNDLRSSHPLWSAATSYGQLDQDFRALPQSAMLRWLYRCFARCRSKLLKKAQRAQIPGEEICDERTA